MKKSAREPRDAGSVTRLNHMIDHSIARKRKFKDEKPAKVTNATLFDMIDKRLGHMIAKSSELQSRLEDIEERRTGHKRQPVPVAAPQRPKPEVEITLNGEPVDDNTLEALNAAVQTLAAEIKEMHEEQKIMKAQVNQMRKFIDHVNM